MVSTHVIYLLAVVCAISALTKANPRILGGEEASKYRFRHAASIRLDGAHICGGSIISSKKILTAAHCLTENGNKVSENRLAVRVGSTNQFSGGKLVYVSDILIHPDYSGVKNDIAVLTLENTLEWTDRIKKINLKIDPYNKPPAGESVMVAGWGEQSSEASSHKLQEIEFSVSTDEECSASYSGSDNSTICLRHELKKGSCTGDAGNGAVYRGDLIGLSSFVIGACGSRFPEVFTSVLYYDSWIKSVLTI